MDRVSEKVVPTVLVASRLIEPEKLVPFRRRVEWSISAPGLHFQYGLEGKLVVRVPRAPSTGLPVFFDYIVHKIRGNIILPMYIYL